MIQCKTQGLTVAFRLRCQLGCAWRRGQAHIHFGHREFEDQLSQAFRMASMLIGELPSFGHMHLPADAM
jgi:hypothetical protein